MKKVLLVVDDEKTVQKAIALQFDQAEVEVIIANNGEEGLQLALEHHPDLILLDLVMPKMDGMTMLGKLREDERGKLVEVIILTNLSDTDEVAQAIERGTFEYLVKVNWNVTDVVNKVKAKLGLQVTDQ